ncbi:MAG: site-specific tyrosine recombinase/integron integrase [Thermoplasmata archaeon]
MNDPEELHDNELNDFISYMIGERKSNYTVKEYSFLIKVFKSFINKPLEKVTAMDIEKFKRYLASTRKYSKSSQYLAIKAIKLFYKSRNIAWPANLTPPKRNIHMPSYLNEDDARKLIEKSKEDARTNAIVSVLIYTGMRVGELCNLKIEDVDSGEGIITIHAGKGDKDRIVVMPDECRKAIEKYLDKRLSMETDNDFLFVSRKKTRFDTSTVERIVKSLAGRAGISKRVTPHVLRHTFATAVLRNGGDIRFIQQILGHSSVATTQIYTHIDDSTLREMYSKHRPRY